MFRLTILLFIITVSACEKPNNNTKKIRQKNEQDSLRQQNVKWEKKSFLSDLSLLEMHEDNLTEISTTELFESYTTLQDFTNTTEEYENSTDIVVTTEISLFSKPDVKPTTPSPTKKQTKINKQQKHCSCDLTYGACDVDCCCDVDCSEEDTKLFTHCSSPQMPYDDRYCYSYVFYYKNNSRAKININSNNLFCILSDNLPEKRAVDYYLETLTTKEADRLTEGFYKWPSSVAATETPKIKFKPYAYGDSLILIGDAELSIFDLPEISLGNYCGNRTPVKYLKNTKVKCITKFSDLEMFNMDEYATRKLFSGFSKNVQEKISNFNYNCSNNDCVNWTINACDYKSCQKFNNSIHSSVCDDSKCVNIAKELKFIFYCSGSMIKRAEIYLYFTDMLLPIMHIQQEIIIKFYMETNNASRPIELSGNSGYLIGKPVIKLYDSGSESTFISNNTFPLKNVMGYPKNVDGKCIYSNTTHEEIKFGINSKSKCRFINDWPVEKNATKACHQIQNQLLKFLGLNLSDENVISPMGNPNMVTNDSFIQMTTEKSPNEVLTGDYQQNITLVCHNFVSLFIYEFVYANFSRSLNETPAEFDRKIIKSTLVHKASEKVKFDMEIPGLIVDTHVQFFDVTKPVTYEYARGPQLYIHFPSDFFYPFTSNANQISTSVCIILVCACLKLSIV